MTRVSVVTPFYNTAAYLAECIESVLAQTHRDLEYVLLDNASTDGSGAIAERYARLDPRIRLERNATLLPQVPNYNRALTLISSDTRYCKVVQADDTIAPRCLEAMVALAEAHPRAALVGSYFHYRDRVEPTGMPHRPAVLSGREACRRQLLDGIFLFGSPTTLLLRADLVRSRVPFYEEGRLFEDTEICFELLREHDFGFVAELLSYMRWDPSSIMGATRDFHPAAIDRLIRLRRFGREYLDPAEYEREVAIHERKYWRILGEAWLRRAPPAFFDFHRKGLESVGLGLRPARLARGVLEVLASPLVAPVRALRRRLRARP